MAIGLQLPCSLLISRRWIPLLRISGVDHTWLLIALASPCCLCRFYCAIETTTAGVISIIVNNITLIVVIVITATTIGFKVAE